MRIGPRYDGVLERIGAALTLVPTPVGLAMFGMPIARTLQVAQRTGVFRELATGPASAGELAGLLGLREQGLALLLDALAAADVLRSGRDGRYALRRRVAKWLDPASPTYVG